MHLPHISGSTLLLAGLGLFWISCGLHFARAMSRGEFRGIQTLHQDLAPAASARAWRYKNAALTAIGALWLATALARSLWFPASSWMLPVAAAAIAVEQLTMPLCTPRHWKSYTGVLVGGVLAGLVLCLDHVVLL